MQRLVFNIAFHYAMELHFLPVNVKYVINFDCRNVFINLLLYSFIYLRIKEQLLIAEKS